MSSSPKDTVETTEPPKSSDADTQPWNEDKRRKFETASSTIRAKRLRKEAIDACSGTEAIRICVESISRHIATANKHGLINGKRKAAAGSNGVIRSRQPALTCWIQPG